MVDDLASSNGTFVNGDRIDGETILRPGDNIEIGPISFQVEYQAPTESPARENRNGSVAKGHETEAKAEEDDSASDATNVGNGQHYPEDVPTVITDELSSDPANDDEDVGDRETILKDDLSAPSFDVFEPASSQRKSSEASSDPSGADDDLSWLESPDDDR